jgi:hypothetical protein
VVVNSNVYTFLNLALIYLKGINEEYNLLRVDVVEGITWT